MCKTSHFLLNQPKFFVIGLVWHSDTPSSENIQFAFNRINPKLYLSHVFENYNNTLYNLKGKNLT